MSNVKGPNRNCRSCIFCKKGEQLGPLPGVKLYTIKYSCNNEESPLYKNGMSVIHHTGRTQDNRSSFKCDQYQLGVRGK